LARRNTVLTFINISNHPSSKWSAEQVEEAKRLGGVIVDMPFPNVPAGASRSEVGRLADEVMARVPDYAIAMVQGEFSLTYAITRRLRWRGTRVVVATSERQVREQVKDGKTEKVAVYEFRGFRDVE
jgi:hypothetical protein